jgi:threonine/homoserine/homoserine lactone efflux protein
MLREMPLPQLLPFALVSMLCILAPGPDNLSVIAYGVSRGRRAGMLFGAGCSSGCLLHTFWLCAGVSALIAASATAFNWLKIAGTGYLFYLAFLAFRGGGLGSLENTAAPVNALPGRIYFRRGFLANALNPKVALFFLAFLPQFTRPGSLPVAAQFFVLGLMFALLTLVIFSAMGFFSGAAGRFLKSHSRCGTWLDRLTGITFVALGLRLLLAQVHSKP